MLTKDPELTFMLSNFKEYGCQKLNNLILKNLFYESMIEIIQI